MSAGSAELYDLETDFGELTNLIDKRPDLVDHGKELINRYLGLVKKYNHDNMKIERYSPEELERMKALGYL